MSKKTRVLFATDFTSAQDQPVSLIRRMLELTSLRLDFLHVVNHFWKNWFASGSYEEAAEAKLKDISCDILAKVEQERLHVLCGHPADLIVQQTRMLSPDITLLGAKPKQDHRYSSAHVTESVIRYGAGSVWVCDTADINRIACAFDASESSLKALEMAVQCCQWFKAGLEIICVVPQPDFYPLRLDIQETSPDLSNYEAAYIEDMDQHLAELDLSAVGYQIYYLKGRPADEILDHCKKQSIDLLVLGSRGHSVMRNVLIGSTMERVMQQRNTSLLMVR